MRKRGITADAQLSSVGRVKSQCCSYTLPFAQAVASQFRSFSLPRSVELAAPPGEEKKIQGARRLMKNNKHGKAKVSTTSFKLSPSCILGEGQIS